MSRAAFSGTGERLVEPGPGGFRNYSAESLWTEPSALSTRPRLARLKLPDRRKTGPARRPSSYETVTPRAISRSPSRKPARASHTWLAHMGLTLTGIQKDSYTRMNGTARVTIKDTLFFADTKPPQNRLSDRRQETAGKSRKTENNTVTTDCGFPIPQPTNAAPSFNSDSTIYADRGPHRRPRYRWPRRRVRQDGEAQRCRIEQKWNLI